jgi:DNA-binding transcriptional LysR family regulator
MEGNYRQLNEWLSKGEIDVLIGYMPIELPGAQVDQILTERLFLACPKPFREQIFGGDAALLQRAREGGLDIRLFAEQPFILLKTGNRIRAQFDSYTAQTGFLPKILLETENIETAFALAEQGMGVTVYPELFLRSLHADADGEASSLDLFPLPGSETLSALAVAFLESGYRSPAVLDFIALCRQQAGLWDMN